MPVATFFTQTTNDKLCVFFLVILLVAQFASLCNSMLATIHIFWALSRDGCFPYSKVWYKLHPKTNVPTNALLLQLVISIILIMPVIIKIYVSIPYIKLTWLIYIEFRVRSLLASYHECCCHFYQCLLRFAIAVSSHLGTWWYAQGSIQLGQVGYSTQHYKLHLGRLLWCYSLYSIRLSCHSRNNELGFCHDLRHHGFLGHLLVCVWP